MNLSNIKHLDRIAVGVLVAFAIYALAGMMFALGGHQLIDDSSVYSKSGGILVLMSILALSHLIASSSEAVAKRSQSKRIRLKRHSDGWLKNTGATPNYERVNVRFSDGEIRWNQETSELNWSLRPSKRIVSFCKRTDRPAPQLAKNK